MDNAPKFKMLLDEIGLHSNANGIVELLFENNITAAIELHPNKQTAIATLDLFDVSILGAEIKRDIFESLLLLNDISYQQASCYTGLDRKDFLVLIGIIDLSTISADGFVSRLNHLQNQATCMRELVEAHLPET